MAEPIRRKKKQPPKKQPRLAARVKFWLQCALAFFVLLLPVAVWLWYSQPHSAEGYYQKAIAEQTEEKTKEAIIDLRLGLKLDPDHIDARILLGELLLRQGAVQSAEKEARMLLQLDGGNRRAQALLRNVKLAQQGVITDSQSGRFQDLKTMEQVELLVRLGNGLLNQSHPENAIEQFESALKIDPDSLAAHLGLARAALLRGDEQQFKARLTTLLDLSTRQTTSQTNETGSSSGDATDTNSAE